MRTDLITIPTMDYGRHILCLPYSILFVLVLVLSNTNDLFSQISCIAQVRVSLDSRGQAQLTPNMFVRGDVTGHTVTVENSQLSDPTIVDCSFINQDVNVIVTNEEGAKCWSKVIVEDKRDFEVIIRDTAIVCTLDIENDALLDLLVVVDNCVSSEDFTISFNTVRDSIFDSRSDTIRRDLRIWSVTDPNGTTEIFTSFIYISRLDTDLITLPADTVVYSSMDAINTDITGVPTVLGSIVPDLCNLNIVTSIQGPFLLDCDKRLKYNRTWTIIDREDWNIVAEEVQTIRFIDTTLETIIAPDLSIEIGEDCGALLEIRDFTVTTDGIGTIIDQYKSILANGDVVFPGDILELLDGDTVIIEYNAFNDCFDPLEPVLDTIIVNVPNELSIVTCNGHAVAIPLDNSLSRTISIDRLFTGTVRSCRSYTLMAARSQYICGSQDTVFSNDVTFCTADLGTTVSLIVMAVDVFGIPSSNTCEILVDVQDNRLPQVECVLSSDTLFYTATDSIARIGDVNRYFELMNTDNIVSVSGSGSGMGSPFGSTFDFTALFNTTGNFFETPVGLDSFNCTFIDTEGVGSYNFDLTVQGSNGTIATCPVNLTLLDTLDICRASSNFVSGMVLAYGRSGLDNVEVTIGTNEGLITWETTDVHGTFVFEMESDATQLTAERSDSWYVNLTSNDLFLLEEILIGSYEPSLLEKASADISNDGIVNTTDFIIMKRLLLGEEPSLIFERSPWDIFAKELSCPETLQCSNGGRFSLDSFEDFNDIGLWAVKEGDIDQDAGRQSESRSINELNYVVEESVGLFEDKRIKILTSEIGLLNSFQVELIIPQDIDIRIEETPGLIYKRYDDRLRFIYTKGLDTPSSDIMINLSDPIQSFHGLNGFMAFDDLEPLIYINGDKRKLTFNEIVQPNILGFHSVEASIYPNPSYGQSTLKLNEAWSSGKIACKIYNEVGQLVWSKNIVNNEESIDDIVLPGDLPIGIYSVVITDKAHKIARKLIKL